MILKELISLFFQIKSIQNLESSLQIKHQERLLNVDFEVTNHLRDFSNS